MKYLRYLALLAAFLFLMAPATKSSQANAQVSFGIGIGVPGYVAPPACAYGYYDYYPYACAPYGFYGPDWFADGLFIGAGPWYHHGWFPNRYRGGYAYRGARGAYVNRGYAARGGYRGGVSVGRGYASHGNFAGRTSGFHGSSHGSFHGGGHGGAHRGR